MLQNKNKAYNTSNLLGGVVNKVAIEESVRQLLHAVGEDSSRDGLRETPERMGRMYEELLAGYRRDPVVLVNNALFNVDYDDMVLVRDIEFFSLCEHHMLPFIGHAHVGYIPNGKVVGLSKILGIVDMFAQRLQVQERMTGQVANFLRENLKPLGAGVVIEAFHLCSMMRGVKKHDARMTTSTMVGTFRTNQTTRQEFLDGVSRGADPLRF